MATPREQRELPYSGIEVAAGYNDAAGLEVVHNPSHWHGIKPPDLARTRSTVVPEFVQGDYQNYHDHVRPPPPIPLTPTPTICGLRRRVFWIIAGVVAFLVIAGAVGGGVGGHLASSSKSSKPSESSTSAGTGPADGPGSNATAPVPPAFPNVSISALGWYDLDGVRQVRVYHIVPANSSDPSTILESSWDSAGAKWSVEAITDPRVDAIKPGTPLTAASGHPHTDTSIALVKNVYFIQPTGKVVERQSPYKEQAGTWGYDNFSGIYTASNLSAVFSYWYQRFDTRLQVLTNFFQDLGANSLTAARYYENGTDERGWQAIRHSIPIQDGSPIAAAPAGSRADLRLYVAGPDGTMKQYPYNVESNILGAVTDTAFDLSRGTPLCVTTEDNRNWFTSETVPECARANRGTFLTHLILFASADRQDLNLVSWNCSSGFLVQKSRISGLLKPGRTYLGLAATPQTHNASYVDQRVFVLFAEGSGPPKMEEWQIPPSGSPDGKPIPGQNGPFRLLGEVPMTLTK